MTPNASEPFLILDEWPQSRAQEAWIFAKIFLKEGVLRNSWRGVWSFGQAFGSLRIPESLYRALIGFGVQFSRNIFDAPPNTVIALKDVRCLRWALQQKSRGKIQRLIAGPFIATLPHEYNEILLNPAIDALLFLSEWHRNLFMREARRPAPPSFIWSAGIDTERWRPLEGADKDQILIFKKQVDSELEQLVVTTLRQLGLRYTVVEYGRYQPEEYLHELRRSLFCICLHKSETQGISTFEAWSCNVPTLHANCGTMNFLGTTYLGASSSPYLTPACGLSFRGTQDFVAILSEMRRRLHEFTPRKFVLNGHTEAQAAARFLQILEKTNQKDELIDPNNSFEFKNPPCIT